MGCLKSLKPPFNLFLLKLFIPNAIVFLAKPLNRNINGVFKNVCAVLLKLCFNRNIILFTNVYYFNFFNGGPFEIRLNQSKSALKYGLLKTSPINGTKLYKASNGR